MSVRLVVLVDERDRQLGTATVGTACFVIRYQDAFFVRTEKQVRLRGRIPALVFEQTEPFTRSRLEPI